MDSELSSARVLVTDIQIFLRGGSLNLGSLSLQDDAGARWSFPDLSRSGGREADTSVHFQTPLAVPLNSGLRIDYVANNSGTFQVNVIGRLVTM